MNASDYSEDMLIEQPAIALFATLGYETINAFHEKFGVRGTLGRLNKGEVVLRARLRAALVKLNPAASSDALEAAVEEMARDRSSLNPVAANREVYLLLKEGLIFAEDADGGESTTETVRFIDWNQPEANDFLLVSQFWVTGEIYTRRADLVAFVNGIPLVLFELKAAHARLEDAFKDNLRDYKTTIPQLFWFNALVVLSTGVESRIGTMSAAWEHFSEWKKINDEGERGVVSLETVIRGVCAPERLLDLIENFTLYSDGSGKLAKLVAKNHQFLGVNNAVARLGELATRPDEDGRLGVFWHTQGSGKSYSMVFFTQKVLRKRCCTQLALRSRQLEGA